MIEQWVIEKAHEVHIAIHDEAEDAFHECDIIAKALRDAAVEKDKEIKKLRLGQLNLMEEYDRANERQDKEIARLKADLAEIERITWREGNSRDDMQRCLIDIRKVAHP
eukprot:GHVU01091434.1.p7 GENE.GHVU01091434.1~~GHVU01091434.1.p7  ORF type:complete len:109 (-),score=25.49 GHVU01091434.1:1728-2054(-)